MDSKSVYEELNKIFDEVRKEEKFPLAVECIMQTGSADGQFSFNISARVSFDEKSISKNPLIPELLENGYRDAVKADIREAYRGMIQLILDRISGVGCERIKAKQKPKQTTLQGEEYEVYGTSQIPPKTILVSYNDDLWRGNNAVKD